MHKPEVLHKLRYLLKCIEIIGPINLKINPKTHKMELLKFRYNSWLIVMIFQAFSMLYYSFEGKILISDGNTNTKTKILILLFFTSILVRYLITIICSCCFKNRTIDLWNHILNLDKTLKHLKLKCVIYHKTTILILLVTTFLNFVYNIIAVISNSNIEIIQKTIAVSGIAITRIIIMALFFKYMVLFTMYKNYFKQLNKKLLVVLTDNPAKNLLLLKNIARAHQYLCDLVKKTINELSLQILLTVSDCFLGLIIHVYSIILILSNYDIIELVMSFYFIIEMCCVILMLIIPSQLCAEQVNVQFNLI